MNDFLIEYIEICVSLYSMILLFNMMVDGNMSNENKLLKIMWYMFKTSTNFLKATTHYITYKAVYLIYKQNNASKYRGLIKWHFLK